MKSIKKNRSSTGGLICSGTKKDTKPGTSLGNLTNHCKISSQIGATKSEKMMTINGQKTKK